MNQNEAGPQNSDVDADGADFEIILAAVLGFTFLLAPFIAAIYVFGSEWGDRVNRLGISLELVAGIVVFVSLRPEETLRRWQSSIMDGGNWTRKWLELRYNLDHAKKV